MANDFSRLAALARQAVDNVHGEAVAFVPMARSKGPHGVAAPDPARETAEITAAFFHDTERAARMRAQPLIGQTGDRLVNRAPEILASLAEAFPVAVGDRLVRAGGETYEIGTRDRDGLGNAIVGLHLIKETA